MGHVFFFLGRLGLLLGLRQGHVSRFALASCQVALLWLPANVIARSTPQLLHSHSFWFLVEI